MPKELTKKEIEQAKERMELEKFLAEVEDYVKNPSKYRKDEMPDFTKPLTEEEKKDYENQYNKAVEALNKSIVAGEKITPDIEGLRNKMNDLKQVEIYRRSKYVNEKINQKQKLLEQYKEELFLHNNSYPISDSLAMLMRTDGSPESDNFNKRLIKLNSQNPNRFGQAVLKGLFKADSTVYNAIIMDDYERSKVYTDNFEHSLIASNVSSIVNSMDNDMHLVNELSNSFMTNLIEIKQELGSDFGYPELMFVIPEMTKEQRKECTFNNNKDTRKYAVKLADDLFDVAKREENKKAVKLLKNQGILDDKEPALSFKAIQTEFGKEHEIDLVFALENNVGKIVKRDDKEKANMLQITNGIRERGLEEFINTFLKSYHERIENTNVFGFEQNKILDNHKGGFFERLFKTTSKEYLDFSENFKNFTDLKSPDFGDKEKLYASAKAYIDHKNVKTEADIAKLDSTGRDRVKFCMAVIDALGMSNKDMEKPIEEINKTANLQPIREKVEGLEKDTDIEKSTIKKTNTSEKEKTKSIEADMTNTK